MPVDPATLAILAKLAFDATRMLHDAMNGEEVTDEQLDALQDQSRESHASFQDAIRRAKERHTR